MSDSEPAATDDATESGADQPADLESLVADNPEEVARLLERLGLVNDLLDAADVATSAMDDEMVMSLASTGTRLGEVADTAADDDVARGLEDVLSALGDATSEEPDEIGAIGLIKATRDPDVKAGLGVMIALARALGQQTRERPEAVDGSIPRD